jgi:DNA-binding response OmpR family regulator
MSSRVDTVLIVEDEQELADTFASVLDDEYEVIKTYSGEAAVESATEEIDAVLLDRKMPGMSGEEVLERLRSRGHDYPVAMVTAVRPDWDIVEMGFDDYLLKPVGMAELTDAVERLGVLGTVDREVREYIRQTVKQAALEGSKDASELKTNETFDTIKSEIADKGIGIEDISVTLSQAEMELLIDTISRNLGPPDDNSPTGL